MVQLTPQDLLKARVHLGHVSKKWNPAMAPFILMQVNKKHVIDLNKTIAQLEKAADALRATARSGKKILFVATKKQAKELIKQTAEGLNMPYMTERWLGGTLTNFITIRKLTKKITSIDKMMHSTSYMNMAKKERLMISRDKVALDRVLGGILDLTKLPGALVVVDITKEHIAVKEANKLGIPVIGLVDTNSDPSLVEYPIPSNDDAITSISILINALKEAISEGCLQREEEKINHSASLDEKNEPVHYKDPKKESSHAKVEQDEHVAKDKLQKRDTVRDRIERRENFQQRAVNRALYRHKPETKSNADAINEELKPTRGTIKVTEEKVGETQFYSKKRDETKVKTAQVAKTKVETNKFVAPKKTIESKVKISEIATNQDVESNSTASKSEESNL